MRALIFFLLLFLIFYLPDSLISQETTKWELLNSGEQLSFDTTSMSGFYKFTKNRLSLSNTISLNNLNKDNWVRTLFEERYVYPKSGNKQDGELLYQQYCKIQISEDRTRTWKTIYFLNKSVNVFNLEIKEFNINNLIYLNINEILVQASFQRNILMNIIIQFFSLS